MENKDKIRYLYLCITAAASLAAGVLFFVWKTDCCHTEEDAESVESPDDVFVTVDDVCENFRDSEVGTELPGEYGIPPEEYDVVDEIVLDGEFFSTILLKLGVPQQKASDLTECSAGVFNLKKIRVGNEYHAFYTKDEDPVLDYLIYDIDRRKYVKFTLRDTVRVEVFEREVRTVMNYSKVNISSSLWVDVKKSGAPVLLAMKLSDIYAWTIDFFGLQKGDSFEAVYETLYCENELLGVERVIYASFVHAGKPYDVYFFKSGKTSNTYWNEKGESMRKAFLKAPLSFTRISSGYGTRVHPITRKVHQHNGVDYAAPKGTPVMSIGDGTVVYAGRKGNEGNMVKIKHNSVYTTAYLHLSKFGKGIKSGARVSQGQVIGYVGSTGRSTGPHLDFRVWKNGSPVNPLKVSSPPAVPISGEQMSDFEMTKSEALVQRNLLLAEKTVLNILDNLRY